MTGIDPIHDFYRYTSALKPAINYGWQGRDGRNEFPIHEGVNVTVEPHSEREHVRWLSVGIPELAGNFEATFNGFIVPAEPRKFRRFGFMSCPAVVSAQVPTEIQPISESLTWAPNGISELDILAEACRRMSLAF